MGKLKSGAWGMILGSLLEEIVEEVLPGVGELEYVGELLGGWLGTAIEGSEDEIKFRVRRLLIFAYRELGGKSDLVEEELDNLKKFFSEADENQRRQIIKRFKEIDPVSFQWIQQLNPS